MKTRIQQKRNNIILPQLKLRPYQRKPFRDHFLGGVNRLMRVIHRRAGKDTEAVQFTHMAALERVGLYFYLLPKINQARTVIWEGRGKDGRKLMDCIPKRLIRKNKETTMTRYLTNGSIIRVTGADNYESLIGSNPLGIVWSEFAKCHPNSWNYLRPILAENDGWALFNSTPRGMNHLYDLWMENKDNPAWSNTLLTVDDTRLENGNLVITPEILEQERLAGMPEALIQQEFYCSFEAAILGAYFTDEMKALHKEGRFSDFPIDPKIQVHTGWDIGVRDMTSISLFQVQPNGSIRCIYYFESNNKPMEYYFDKLSQIKQELGFTSWGQHFAPHDINVREWAGGKSRIEQARSMGFIFKPVANLRIVEGIQAMRHLFPRFVFHSGHTKLLIKALSEYHADWDFDKKVFSLPVHDWTSHPVDSVRTFAIGYLDTYDKPRLLQQIKYARDLAA